jgi:hypothetical protein
LGFCGPRNGEGRKIISGFAAGDVISPGKVRAVLEQFEALFPYLKLIASEGRIDDPFHERVVRAFWVGNELLDAVKVSSLQQMILTEFAKPGLLSKEEAKRRASQVVEGMVPHHSFHVLVLGAVAGRVQLTNALKDLCRVGWGEVLAVSRQRSKVRVAYQPLLFGKRVSLGRMGEKELERDKKIAPAVSRGDWVSFHWGSVCERLGEGDLSNLKRYTQKTLNVLSK